MLASPPYARFLLKANNGAPRSRGCPGWGDGSPVGRLYPAKVEVEPDRLCGGGGASELRESVVLKRFDEELRA